MTDLPPFEAGPANFTPFAARGLNEGLSGNAILNAWRAAGGHIDRTTGLKLIGEVRGLGPEAQAIAALDENTPVPIDLMQRWAANGPGEFAHFYVVHGHFRRETDVFEFRGTVYSPTPLSAAQVADEAWDQFNAAFGTGQYGEFVGQGVVQTSVAQLVGRGNF